MYGKKSHARETRCEVPQGSNLDPILFLASEIEIKHKKYFENVHSWLRCNKLTLPKRNI